ncbi:MAG: hypothetical protein EA341_09690, partial [Mongoliibacter sp.]|uniref:YDG domain-containing protein n=1 Tax=Mongoliibacter sp. TaxID=2022438 RepID=UPI0012F17845
MKTILLFFLCLVAQVSHAQTSPGRVISPGSGFDGGDGDGGSTCTTPSITNQPSSATITYGEDVEFKVIGSGNVSLIQWQEFNDDTWTSLSNGGIYSGVTSTTLTLLKPSFSLSGRKYRVVLTGCNTEVTSNGVATLTVNKADQIINWANPANITFGTALGADQLNATLTTGEGELTYNPPSGTILNAGQSTLRVDAAGTANFNAAFKEVSITVEDPLAIAKQPEDLTINYGERLSFSVEASGTEPFSYQWQLFINEFGFEDLAVDFEGGFSGSKTATLEFETPIVSNTGLRFRVRVNDANGREVISEPATVTVNPKEITASIIAQAKTYDGSTNAEAKGSVPTEDLISGDVVNVSVENAAFAEANVGTWI